MKRRQRPTPTACAARASGPLALQSGLGPASFGICRQRIAVDAVLNRVDRADLTAVIVRQSVEGSRVRRFEGSKSIGRVRAAPGDTVTAYTTQYNVVMLPRGRLGCLCLHVGVFEPRGGEHIDCKRGDSWYCYEGGVHFSEGALIVMLMSEHLAVKTGQLFGIRRRCIAVSVWQSGRQREVLRYVCRYTMPPSRAQANAEKSNVSASHENSQERLSVLLLRNKVSCVRAT
jgi:hypothetical protein